jgi:hypothetical protein
MGNNIVGKHYNSTICFCCQIAKAALKNSVTGEVLKTKAPNGVQMIMTKLDGASTVGADTVSFPRSPDFKYFFLNMFHLFEDQI